MNYDIVGFTLFFFFLIVRKRERECVCVCVRVCVFFLVLNEEKLHVVLVAWKMLEGAEFGQCWHLLAQRKGSLGSLNQLEPALVD